MQSYYPKYWDTSYILPTVIEPTLVKLLATIDLESVEALLESHLGPNYTLIILKSGEKITVAEPINEVRGKLVRIDQQIQCGEVLQ